LLPLVRTVDASGLRAGRPCHLVSGCLRQDILCRLNLCHPQGTKRSI
jgi:hypothetical protein